MSSSASAAAFRFRIKSVDQHQQQQQQRQVVCGPDGCCKLVSAAGGSASDGRKSARRAPSPTLSSAGASLVAAAAGRDDGGATGGRKASSKTAASKTGGPRSTKAWRRPTVTVDVWSDVLCPWCYYGKRGLDVAMRAAADEFRFEVRWHPFMIRPNIPRAGRTPAESGIGTRDRPYFHYIKERAMEAYGLDMGGKCDRYPNTLKAHSLLLWALRADASKQHRLMELVFRAYYSENRFVGSDAVLLELAAAAGYDSPEQRASARAWLASAEGEAEAWAQYTAAARRGLSGVPDFSLALRGNSGKGAARATTEIHGGAHASAFAAAFRQLRAKAAAKAAASAPEEAAGAAA